ncbi:hypothetical protein D3C72_1916240 [compost metagenome]
MEELAEAMQRHLQPWRIQQAQAQVFERPVAQRPAEDARHFIVDLLGEQAVQRRELFLSDARRRLGQQLAGDARALRQPCDRGGIGAGQEAVDDRDGDSSGQAVHAGRRQCMPERR